MKENKKIHRNIVSFITILVILITNFMCLNNVSMAATTYSQELREGLDAFPESYRILLERLIDKTGHTNWNFQAYYTGIDWSDVEKAENACLKNTIYKSYPEWFCICNRTGDVGYYCACKKIVNYYLDPRNFLTEQTIMQFLDLSYAEESQSIENIQEAVKNSFLRGNVDVNGQTMSYSEIILEAARQSGMSPLSIVSKIFQEIGTGVSNGEIYTPRHVSGTDPTYPNCYNFYGFGATDGVGAVERGLIYASEHEWNDPYTALVEGAKLLSNSYINAGQNTQYLFKFDVVGTRRLSVGESVTVSRDNLFSHQYMTNIQDPTNQAKILFDKYNNNGLLNQNLTFIIPIYNNMPSYIKLPTNLTENDGELYYIATSYNNLTLRADAYSGATSLASMERNTVVIMLDYNVNGTGWSKIRLENGIEGYASNEYLLPCNYSNNTSGGGDVEPIERPESKNYNIESDKIVMEPDVTLDDIKANYNVISAVDRNGNNVENNLGTGATVTTDSGTFKVVKLGDCSGDGIIDARDAARILRYSIGTYDLYDEYLSAVDINKDGIIDARDAARILKFSVGQFNINL